MKEKYYSTLMILAVMVTALSFTACIGDDDEDVSFSIYLDKKGRKENTAITYSKGEVSTYFEYYQNAVYEKRKNRFVILPMQEVYEIDIYFPSHSYVASDFQKGTKLFSADNVEIRHWGGISLNWFMSSVIGSVISGSASIIKNDGNHITIRFNNYKYSIEDPNDNVIEVTLNGELKFKITD